MSFFDALSTEKDSVLQASSHPSSATQRLRQGHCERNDRRGDVKTCVTSSRGQLTWNNLIYCKQLAAGMDRLGHRPKLDLEALAEELAAVLSGSGAGSFRGTNWRSRMRLPMLKT
jgi:hypothetical protein